VGVVLQSACLYVCLFVCLLAYLKSTCPNFVTFSEQVICGRGSFLLWRQRNMLCTSGFVDDAVFSHNGANGPESKTTRLFHPLRKDDGTRGEVRLHLV